MWLRLGDECDQVQLFDAIGDYELLTVCADGRRGFVDWRTLGVDAGLKRRGHAGAVERIQEVDLANFQGGEETLAE